MVRVVSYLLAAWGLLGGLAATWHPALAVALLVIAAYVTLPVLTFARRGGTWRRYPTAAFRLAVVRPALYGIVLLPLVSAAALLGLLAGLPFGRAVAAGRWAGLGALGAGAVLLVAGWVGSRRLRVREVEARVPGLPAAWDGLRVVQLSDLHVGPQTSRRLLTRAAQATAALHPDLVVLTGDLVDDRAEDAAVFARWVGELANVAPAPLGMYAIPGNHDVYAGWPAVASELQRRTPLRLLVNDAHLLRRGDATLAVVGVGDPAGGRATGPGSPAPDLPHAFSRVPAGVPVLALAHNPVLFGPLAAYGPALTLSGHTHWGQLALPARGWSLASPFQEFAMGGYQRGASLLYVHPGTGFWGLPFRLGAYPEVTAITLRAASPKAPAALVVGEARRAP